MGFNSHRVARVRQGDPGCRRPRAPSRIRAGAAILEEVEDTLRKTANGDMRRGAQEIAATIVIPQLQRSARGRAPIRISRAMAATARPSPTASSRSRSVG